MLSIDISRLRKETKITTAIRLEQAIHVKHLPLALRETWQFATLDGA
jgi:hypothetical protein